MKGVREALDRIINHHEPYPAFVVDRRWRIIMGNTSATRLVSACVSGATIQSLSPDGRLNFTRMMFEPTQMRARIRNWPLVGPRLSRLRSEARGDPQLPSAALLKELGPSADCSPSPEDHEQLELPTVPLELVVDDIEIVQYDHDFRHASGCGIARTTNRDVFPMDQESRTFLTKTLARRRSTPASRR